MESNRESGKTTCDGKECNENGNTNHSGRGDEKLVEPVKSECISNYEVVIPEEFREAYAKLLVRDHQWYTKLMATDYPARLVADAREFTRARGDSFKVNRPEWFTDYDKIKKS